MTETLENHDQPEANEAPQDRLAELEKLLAQKDAELGLASIRAAGFEQALYESNGKLKETADALAQAVSSYRSLAIESHPLVPPEMLKGDSIEAINASLKSAKEIISKVKTGLEAEGKAARVPAGAPQRRHPDRPALSPRDKIQQAIGGK